MRNLARDLRIRLESCAFISSEFPQLESAPRSQASGKACRQLRGEDSVLRLFQVIWRAMEVDHPLFGIVKTQMQRASRRRAVVQLSRD